MGYTRVYRGIQGFIYYSRVRRGTQGYTQRCTRLYRSIQGIQGCSPKSNLNWFVSEEELILKEFKIMIKVTMKPFSKILANLHLRHNWKTFQIFNRTLYSCVLSYLAFKWKWGWCSPCYDTYTDLPPFLMLNNDVVVMLVSKNLHKQNSEVSIKTRPVNWAHNCKIDYSRLFLSGFCTEIFYSSWRLNTYKLGDEIRNNQITMFPMHNTRFSSQALNKSFFCATKEKRSSYYGLWIDKFDGFHATNVNGGLLKSFKLMLGLHQTCALDKPPND